MNADVRDRSREILRAELAIAAADFCAEHGFDSVTVDEIAHGIGISRATYFRYFRSKEDAVVAATRAGRQSLADAVRMQPNGTSALGAVRAALAPTVEAVRKDPERLRARLRMISATPGLRARLSLDRAEERDSLAASLSERIPGTEVARAIAGSAMAAIDLGWNLWAADSAADLGDSLDLSFALVAGAGAVRLSSEKPADGAHGRARTARA